MNDVSNRAVREFSEFLNSIEADFPKPTCTTAYEITMKSTIVSALITLDTEKQMRCIRIYTNAPVRQIMHGRGIGS